MKNKSVLIVIDHYLPSQKAGGPLRSVPNLVKNLSEIDFLIITRDRDLGSKYPLSDIVVDQWTKSFDANIFYASPSRFSIISLMRLINNSDCASIYLNSLFSFRATIIPLLLRLLNLTPKVKYVLAPRGELSPGALSLKKIKKLVFLYISISVGLYKDIVFHATSETEFIDIKKYFPSNLCSDSLVYNPVSMPVPMSDVSNIADSRIFSIVFISRIVEKKNLHFLIELLNDCSIDLRLNIYGPIEDSIYWKKCLNLIDCLPPNVAVIYGGDLGLDEVATKLSENDLFVFPTLGENFGHVIFESLSVGTPVIVSSFTPWEKTTDGYIINALSLDSRIEWVNAIKKHAALTMNEKSQLRARAVNFASDFASNSFDSSAMYRLLS